MRIDANKQEGRKVNIMHKAMILSDNSFNSAGQFCRFHTSCWILHEDAKNSAQTESQFRGSYKQVLPVHKAMSFWLVSLAIHEHNQQAAVHELFQSRV